MTVHAPKKDAKEIWCSEVRKLRARPGISGKSGNSGKNPDSPGLLITSEKQHSSRIFNLTYNILRK
jgi:hypothetical protein